MRNNITCPKCSHEFTLTDLHKKEVQVIKEDLKTEIEKDLKDKHEIELKTVELAAQTDAIKKFRIEKEEHDKKYNLLKEQLNLIEENKKTDLQRIESEITAEFDRKIKLKDFEVAEKLMQKDQKIKELIDNSNLQSSQISGEVGENYIVDSLKKAFPNDTFIEIKRGEDGGDWIQEIRDTEKNLIDRIYIESKNTKSFLNSWIPKLQKDMEDREITLGVLISRNFPKKKQGLNAFEDKGIQIYKLDSNIFVSHIRILRKMMYRLYVQTQLGRVQKSDIPSKVYDYLNSEQYKNTVQQLTGVLSLHNNRVEKRRKDFARIINEDEQMLQNSILLLAKILKNDINQIAEEEIISIDELDNFNHQ